MRSFESSGSLSKRPSATRRASLERAPTAMWAPESPTEAGAAASQPPEPPPLPPFLGTERFELLSELGRGGMSVVHVAFDHSTGRRLALKVLKEPKPERLSVLKEEFRLVARIVHPHLVHMHELFEVDGRHFFTMELIDGMRLWEWVRAPHYSELGLPPQKRPKGYDQPPRPLQGQAAWARLLSAAGQLATALGALHVRRILHRDVKPPNVLVRPDGTVVVLDFGLSRSLKERRPDPYGRIGGTLAYMAPEQLELGPPSTSADWYAMGATLFELAAGCLPYAGDEDELYDAKLRRDPPRPLLSVAPNAPPQFAKLVDDLLDPNPDGRPVSDEVLAALGLRGAAGTETMPELRRVVLKPVGRTTALEFLEEGAVEATTQGRALRELRGESGIGKSTLALWFARRAKTRGAVVFRGECFERESIPFKAFDRLIERLIDRIARRGPAGRADVVPRNRRALLRLFPAFGRLPEFAADGPESDPAIRRPSDSAALRRDAFEALGTLLARYAAGRLILIVLDDIQWADRDSAALAAHLLARPDSPLMLLLCRRPEGDELDLTAFGDGDDLPPKKTHDLGPLDERDARELARRTLGSDCADDVVDAVVRESDGSPFWLEQLGLFTRAPAQMGPDRSGIMPRTPDGPLESLLQVAVRECSDEARDLLLTLAIAGRPVDRALAMSVTGESALRSADHLETTGLLVVRRTERGAGLELRHGRVADAVLAVAGDSERQEQHARIAGSLIELGGDPEEISDHLFASKDPARAAVYALDGSRAARDQLAFDRAARLLQVAIEHESDPAARLALTIELADVLSNDSRGAEAADAYLAAAAMAEGAQALDLEHHAAEQLMRSGRIDEGRALLEGLLEGHGLNLRRSAAVSTLYLLWGRARLSARGTGFEPRDEADIEPATLSRIDTAWSAAVTLGLVDAVGAAAFQVQGLLLALEVGEPKRVARALGAEAVFHAVFGGLERADELLARQRQLVDDLDDPAELAGSYLARAVVEYQRGDWPSCHAAAAHALKHLSGLRTNLAWTRSTAVVYLLAAAGHLGRLSEIVDMLPRELAHAHARGDLHARMHLSLGMPVALDAILDRPAIGLERAQAVWADSRHQHYDQLQIHALRTQAELALVSGDVEAALAAGRKSFKLADVPARLRIVVVYLSSVELALRCELLAAARDGLDRKRRRSIARHIGRLEKSDAPWARACGALARAQLGALDADSGRALAAFDRAMSMFADCGMRLHQETARYGRGGFLGGAAGRDERARAAAWAESEGVVAPLKLFRMIGPAITVGRDRVPD